jgi:hypothetical protein
MSKYAVSPLETLMVIGPSGRCIVGVGVVALIRGMKQTASRRTVVV